ncbi:MAG: monovalent cation/H+ antiporter subunit D family protein [Planctomycetes bacterium]|nr:monovalent cation/H+ antiporter subunit D family protein [Planctomycetota bacterium]
MGLFEGLFSGHGVAFLAMLIPLIAAGLIALTGKWPNVREGITLVSAVILCIIVLSLAVPSALADNYWQTSAQEDPAVLVDMLTTKVEHAVTDGESEIQRTSGLSLAFKIEPMGMMYAIIASCLWILNSLYSIGYMRGNKEKHQTRFYVCFALAICSVMGIAFSANMFTLFVFYEALTLSTFPLVSHKGTPAAVRSSRTYLGILVGTSVGLLLLGVIFTEMMTGNLDFTPGGVFGPYLQSGGSQILLALVFALYIYGIGKAALMPMHRWLPAAMVAPTPVSALLHAVAVVKAGVFTVLKITVYIFGTDTLASIANTDWLIYMACFTIVVASCIALFQDNLKRRLAYSTISQLSYIVLAAGLACLGGPVAKFAIMAGVMHIAAHAFGKITLFFAAGSIYTAAHKTEISQLDGIGRRMPWTMGAFAIASLSMIGVPPTAGFVSKLYLVSASVGTAELSLPQIVAICAIFLSTLLNAAYFLPIVHRAFFKPLSQEDQAHPHGEAPWPMVVALSGTALATVVFFFYSDWATAIADKIAEAM